MVSETLPRQIWHAVVTGHSGFIGRRLTARLESEGVVVTGLSRSTGFEVAADALLLNGDDHVFHLAGMSYVPEAWADPAGCYRTNTLGTVNVLEQCRATGASMTFVSTFIYGAQAPMPVPETVPANPNNPYAFSKFAAEEACRHYARAHGVKVSILRLFNTYGAGHDPKFLVPTIARQALDASVPEIVVADLSPRRDFVHVDDVVEALLLSPRLPAGEAFNIGSGRSQSVGDVIAACVRAAGANKPFRDRGEKRPGEIADIVADISAMTAATGWRPQMDFETGIAQLVRTLASERAPQR